MVFSSPLFLFLFLPVVLGLYLVCPGRLRNGLLLAASLSFYAWGEPKLVAVMIVSIVMNWALVLPMNPSRPRASGMLLALAVAGNLGLLGFYKYGHFLVENLNPLLTLLGQPSWEWAPRKLPIGISFYTFQALSYVIDAYRGDVPVQRSPLRMALYITLFPQLIAGPIVRYINVAAQMESRRVTLSGFASGVQRFVLGLGKKVLVANALATVADAVFEIPNAELGPGVAWLGIVCYALQVYFDFSGYSDMAIGLGRMFGFEFLENFNYPYIARSISDFWRRWHISLSTWFRDYLYVPLGGSRCATWRVYTNLMIVFVLCGLWHGASWNFVAWGAFHGVFLIAERAGGGKRLARWPATLQHLYVLLTVVVGLTIFRAADIPHAGVYLQALSGWKLAASSQYHVGLYLDLGLVLALSAAVVGSTPWLPWAERAIAPVLARRQSAAAAVLFQGLSLVRLACLAAVFLASAVMLTASTYNPFIYFRF